jgi:hypothetical protein
VFQSWVGVESRQRLDRGRSWRQGQRTSIRGRGQRSEIERSETELELEMEQKKSIITKVPGFAKRSTESNWVIDSIFKLRNIHVREVAYKQWETN